MKKVLVLDSDDLLLLQGLLLKEQFRFKEAYNLAYFGFDLNREIELEWEQVSK
jgi:hypothetical protein